MRKRDLVAWDLSMYARELGIYSPVEWAPLADVVGQYVCNCQAIGHTVREARRGLRRMAEESRHGAV